MYKVSDSNSCDTGLSYDEAVHRIWEWYQDSAAWATGDATEGEHQTIRDAIDGVAEPAADGTLADLLDYAGSICEAVATAAGHRAWAGHGNYYVSAASEGGYNLTVDDDPASANERRSEMMNKTMQSAVDTAPRGTSGLVIEPWTIGETYGVAADWSQAAGPVFALGGRGWEPTPHQVADFSHCPTSALAAELRDALIASGDSGAEATALVADATEF